MDRRARLRRRLARLTKRRATELLMRATNGRLDDEKPDYKEIAAIAEKKARIIYGLSPWLRAIIKMIWYLAPIIIPLVLDYESPDKETS